MKLKINLRTSEGKATIGLLLGLAALVFAVADVAFILPKYQTETRTTGARATSTSTMRRGVVTPCRRNGDV